jgi:APA family basic amino acid/polyamine antiporter
MLVLVFGQTRVFYQMARDGLLPKVFSTVNPRFKTPAAGTILLGGVIAFAAAVLPLDLLGDLVSLGTATAFAIVCMSVIYLRKHEPDLERPFKVPFYPVTPILGIVGCVVFMMGPIVLDILGKGLGMDLIGALFGAADPEATRDPLALWILVVYGLVGAAIYYFFGRKHAKLGRGPEVHGHEPPPIRETP